MYLYPQNLRANANLWLWSLKDFSMISIALLVSVIAVAQAGWLLPLALTAGYAFVTIRMEEATVLDYVRYAARYFLVVPAILYMEARLKEKSFNQRKTACRP